MIMVIQVDIGGHPPIPLGPPPLLLSVFYFSHSLLFLAVFRVLNFWIHFEALNNVFSGMLRLQNFIMKFCVKCCIPRIDLSNGLSYA
jgi:hypothetical protein